MEIRRLSQEIEMLRNELNSMVKSDPVNLHSPQVQEISSKLDTLILQFMNLRRHETESTGSLKADAAGDGLHTVDDEGTVRGRARSNAISTAPRR
ncbi:MAG TPA: aspartyl-phosphate phosphatase Spo0E family protein [Firmicutes bacterium]|nr:aspartyl-phosphate phosphatase Spo0E family protein [Bacillota bacterium]